MPKGVEHYDRAVLIAEANGCVESLMPKGVEHIELRFYAAQNRLCWISDAERRWARTKICKISFPWSCVESLMPKGVEHHIFGVTILLLSSVESLMPKGVEHSIPLLIICKSVACWISDAERRWALPRKQRPRKSKLVLNLWCRKALSTR